MPYALNLYHDQIGTGGATSAALPAAHRMLYVRQAGSRSTAACSARMMRSMPTAR